MKNLIAVPFLMLGVGLIACANYKPSSALPPHPSSKAISNVGMTPDYELSAAADAGKATQEIASTMPAATSEQQDAAVTDVVSFNNASAGDGESKHESNERETGNQSADLVKTHAATTTVAEQMLPHCNALGVYRVESPALTAAAQEQANWLKDHGYSMYSLAHAPPGVTGHEWGNGTSQSRAAKHGFQGSLLAPNPGSSNYIVGETIALRSNYDPAGVIHSWNRRLPGDGHWKPLVSPQYDVAGFGYAKNPQGEHIFVAMFGDTRQRPAPAATAIPAARSAVSYTQPRACPGGVCGQVFYPQRQYVQQPQQWQYQRPGLLGWRR